MNAFQACFFQKKHKNYWQIIWRRVIVIIFISLRDNSSYGNIKLKSSFNTAVSKIRSTFPIKVILRRAVTWDTTVLNEILSHNWCSFYTVTKESDLDYREYVLKKATLSYCKWYFCGVLCFNGFTNTFPRCVCTFFNFLLYQ